MNFEYASRVQEEEGFLKPYLLMMNEMLGEKGIKLVNSKWKKAVKILQFIGATKQEGQFKKFTLVDCILTPNILASSLEELEVLTEINSEVIRQMLPFYGPHKFMKHVKDHFWISESTKKYYYSLS